jgi:phenylalanyl-tRNA synthetase beta chain
MMEMGQPLHAFDYDRLKENRIVVKRAEGGDTFTTLDGQTRQMDGEILMICDGERSVALAGIMGGLNSEIFEGSTNVLVESAYFDPITIRRGSKRLGLFTEASYRFERGIDPDGVTSALKRSLMLIADLAGGNIAKGIIDNYPRPRQSPHIDLRIDKTNGFLGTDISKETMVGYLNALEMDVREVDKNTVRVDPPSFRVDIEREIDLMEEVARLEGYDNIPVTYPAIRPSKEKEIPELILREKVRETMVGYGFNEIITYSFISPESAEILGAQEMSPIRSFVKLLNPLSAEQSVMRTSLVPGLLSTVRSNISHGEPDLKVFEWGKVFILDGEDELPQERYTMAAIMTGLYDHKSWYADSRPVDFYDIKGTIEGLLKSMNIKNFFFKKGDMNPWYDPDVSSGIYFSGVKAGEAGEVHEELLKRCDLKIESAFLFEIDIQTLMENMPEKVRFEPFARFPAVLRDISIVVKRQVESHSIKEIIRHEGGGLVESVQLFDLYEGGSLGSGEKALSFRICYRSRKGTLGGKEVNLLHDGIIGKIRQHTGGRLREG